MTAAAWSPATFGENLNRLIHSRLLAASTVEVARRDVVYGCMAGDRSIYLVDQGQVKAVAPSREA